jgi:branched-chain amino acid transport system ATP-binding protein
MTALLSVHNLSKRFGGIVAIDGVSLDVAKGEILGVVGPSGSGKSTLFNCMLGQLKPSAGEVRLDGRLITGMRPCDVSRLGVARTFQTLQIFPKLTVRDNLILAGQEHRGTMWSRLIGPADAGLAETAAEMMSFFRLDGLADQVAVNLTDGQQKLLDFAMAFMARPRLVALDDPTAGLDPPMLAPLRERLRAINSQAGATFVIITRDIDFAMSLCTRLLVLAEGRIIADGDPETVRRDTDAIAFGA